MKAKKTRLLDEQMAKRLHDKEVEQAAAREKQEKDNLEKAKVLQKQYEDKQENIDWNTFEEKMQEKHLDNIKKYQSLKRKPIPIAQARKNMIVYLKNMAGYKMKHFKGMTYDKESFKKLKAVEVAGSHSTQDTPTNDPKEVSEEDIKNMLEIVPVFEFKVEALQVKEDLDVLWRLVKEKFSSAVPTVDKEKALWVELKILFEPDADDVIWKLQRERLSLVKWSHNPDAEHKVWMGHQLLVPKDKLLSRYVLRVVLSGTHAYLIASFMKIGEVCSLDMVTMEGASPSSKMIEDVECDSLLL
nr:hypothetical protein [Tanacetum cinerariifolium]